MKGNNFASDLFNKALENNQMHQEEMSKALFEQQLEMKETLFEVKRSLEKQEKPQAEVTKTDLEQLKKDLTIQIEKSNENKLLFRPENL